MAAIDPIIQSQLGKEVTANAAFEALGPAGTYARRASTSSGLTWGYYGGTVMLSSGTITAVLNGTLTLTASATNYVVAAKATGVVSASTATTNWDDAANYWRLYSVVAGSATATSYTDARMVGLFLGADGAFGAVPRVIDVSSTSAALRITQRGTGVALLVEDDTSPDNTPVAVDTAGRLLVGSPAAVLMTRVTVAATLGNTAPFGLLAAATAGGSTLGSYLYSSAAANAKSGISLARSRGADTATRGALSSGDVVSAIDWLGDDGATGVVPGATIYARVSAAPSSGVVPMSLRVATTDSAAAPADRVEVLAAGRILMGPTLPTDDAANALQVNGGVRSRPPASNTPVNNGDMVFELTSNTTLTIKVKGSDGVVRSVALTLA